MGPLAPVREGDRAARGKSAVQAGVRRASLAERYPGGIILRVGSPAIVRLTILDASFKENRRRLATTQSGDRIYEGASGQSPPGGTACETQSGQSPKSTAVHCPSSPFRGTALERRRAIRRLSFSAGEPARTPGRNSPKFPRLFWKFSPANRYTKPRVDSPMRSRRAGLVLLQSGCLTR